MVEAVSLQGDARMSKACRILLFFSTGLYELTNHHTMSLPRYTRKR